MGRRYARSMRCDRRISILAAALLLTACGSSDGAPLDGGSPLRFERDPEAVALMKNDPCWRREKGAWHSSVGHCREMTPSKRMTGVFVLAFEERSFFPNKTAIPDANDPLRFTHEIELDYDAVGKYAPASAASENGDAFLLTFIGRRTRDPYSVDCQGLPQYTTVVDRLISARYIGPMGPFDVERLKALPTTVSVRHDGRLGELEAEAVKRCSGRRSASSN